MVRCPRCGKDGSLHVKRVKGGSGKEYEAYYMAHYLTKQSGKKGVKWCHIPKSFIEDILEKFKASSQELESQKVKCRDCSRLGKTLYCGYIKGLLLEDELDDPITCAGFQKKESKGKLEK